MAGAKRRTQAKNKLEMPNENTCQQMHWPQKNGASRMKRLNRIVMSVTANFCSVGHTTTAARLSSAVSDSKAPDAKHFARKQDDQI
jgi:hypothetical protein